MSPDSTVVPTLATAVVPTLVSLRAIAPWVADSLAASQVPLPSAHEVARIVLIGVLYGCVSMMFVWLLNLATSADARRQWRPSRGMMAVFTFTVLGMGFLAGLTRWESASEARAQLATTLLTVSRVRSATVSLSPRLCGSDSLPPDPCYDAIFSAPPDTVALLGATAPTAPHELARARVSAVRLLEAYYRESGHPLALLDGVPRLSNSATGVGR